MKTFATETLCSTMHTSSSTAMHRVLAKYESSDSVVFLDPHAYRSSSTSSPRTSQASSDGDDAPAPPPTQPLTVALSVRSGRLLLVTIVAVGGILALMVVFNHGVAVKRFGSSQYDKAAQQKLLDDYNSYSGNVSSVFGKPIELLVPLLVQIFMLRWMAQAWTQPEATLRLRGLALVVSAVVGYLITNGFNAVNVQLRLQDVQPVISASDLTLGSGLNETVAASTTTVTKTVSERTPGNLISNTVLRNAVLPRVTLKQDICDYDETISLKKGIPLPTVDYGFTQRDWQKRLLQRALEPKTLRVVVNPIDEDVNNAVRAEDLPMDAATAADLTLYALTIGSNMLPWGVSGGFVDKPEFEKRFPSSSPLDGDPTYADSVARRLSFLPPSRDADETTKREWFLNELPLAVSRQFNSSVNTSRTNIGVEFSTVAITPDITFEAVTFEVDLDPTLLTTKFTNSNTTRLTQLWQASDPGSPQNCGPWPALCLITKQQYKGDKSSSYEVDALQLVHAFGSCSNKNDTEELWTSMFTDKSFGCFNASNSSMMVMSIGKRLAATSFEQNKSTTAGGEEVSAVLTDLRKVYTFTIGRLSWQLQDLSSTFHAVCGVNTTEAKCMGLQVPLSSSSLNDNAIVTSGDVRGQHLVVSADALPTAVLVPSDISYFKPRAVPLVEVSESPFLEILAGDLLLPHNAGDITWANTTLSGRGCDADIEAHLYTRVNNHLYIEHSFQVAYTAATFFLLQNGVVKDTIPLAGGQSVTLSFDRNVQNVLVWVSTPYQNAMLSIVGCTLLVVGLVATALKATLRSSKEGDPLEAISTPQAIARVMLDDYNSYSGNVSSVFSKPIELLVPLLVQIFMLRWMAQAWTQPEATLRLRGLALVVSAVVGYLITNGFNAVNVQLRLQDVQPVISASDLAVGSGLNETVAASTTTVTKTVSERTPGNLISNTVLRNAVLPRVTLKQDICDYDETISLKKGIPLPTVDYGFTQRDWQKRLLQRALEPKTLRVVVNPTVKDVNNAVRAEDLPMDAATAADLTLYVLAIGHTIFPWGERWGCVNNTEFDERFPNIDSSHMDSTARQLSFLPPSSDADETTKREWFLKELPPAVSRQFNSSVNTSRTNIGVEFSTVAITADIKFEAVTFEVDLDPKLLATNYTNSNTTRLTEVIQARHPGFGESNCGPWSAMCMIRKQPYQGDRSRWDEFDALQLVHAFGSCRNKNGTEELWTDKSKFPDFYCVDASDSSMMVMSIGKRLVATAFEQNKSTTVDLDAKSAVLTDLRKVYTFTIGRLSWQLQNLSSTFHAECGIDTSKTKCMGLQVPLSSSLLSDNGMVASGEVGGQYLVVSADALPTTVLLPTFEMSFYKPRVIPLVEVSESPYIREIVAGDLLLPHNAGDITWANTTLSDTQCDANMEAHLFTRLNNHLYIEHSFQAAYTAATFFLLQNGVVKDTIPLAGGQSVTLSFDRNVQNVLVWVSTPYQNAMLSIVGCTLLVVGLVATALKATLCSSKEGDPLEAISTPQAIARVMLDDKQFPSFLLDRRIVDEGDPQQQRELDQCTITGVTMDYAEEGEDGKESPGPHPVSQLDAV